VAGLGGGWLRRPVGRGVSPTPPDPPVDPCAGLRTFLEPGAEFEGALRLRESIRIEGEFRGEITSEATVVVGENAAVVARVRAREVVIAGAVVGDVVATRTLSIRAGGRLHGDVETPCLEIEKGAVFNGRTHMVRPEVAARATADPGGAEPAEPLRPAGSR
jgi:cytoskeletal protein CcmA (bactofilin family)